MADRRMLNLKDILMSVIICNDSCIMADRQMHSLKTLGVVIHASWRIKSLEASNLRSLDDIFDMNLTALQQQTKNIADTTRRFFSLSLCHSSKLGENDPLCFSQHCIETTIRHFQVRTGLKQQNRAIVITLT